MRINRERMKKEKKKADKKLQEDIKKDPKVYKDCINDLKIIKKELSKIDLLDVDEDIVKSTVEVAESSLYEALASGLKRKDIAFFERYVDTLKARCKKILINYLQIIKNKHIYCQNNICALFFILQELF